MASVNHQHLHIYYLHDPIVPHFKLTLESVPLQHVIANCYSISEDDYPASGFAFVINQIQDIDTVCSNAVKLTDFLAESDIAHNVFITRGKDVNEDSNEYNTIRIFIWARKKSEHVSISPEQDFCWGGSDLSGQVLVYNDQAFECLTEESLAKSQREFCQPIFRTIMNDVKTLFT